MIKTQLSIDSHSPKGIRESDVDLSKDPGFIAWRAK
jgi:hypothetical protein